MKNGKATSVLICSAVAIGLGTAIGTAKTLMTFENPDWIRRGETSVFAESALAENDSQPAAQLLSPSTYNFGMMARGALKSHAFKLKNVGTAPLTVSIIDTTCKCTVGELEKDKIPAGETVDVNLTWRAEGYEREFRQSASLETNDPLQPEIHLSVYGKVTQLVRPEPHKMTLSRMSRNEPQSLPIKVYSFRDVNLTITGHDFSDRETADFFDVTTRPLPPEQIDDKEAVAGIGVQVDIKPGLPLGEVKQLLLLHTNKEDIAPIELAIEATVVSDISIIGGSKFRYGSNTLVLGPVPKATGTQVKLHVLVKGGHRENVEFRVASIDPDDVLQASIGAPREINQGVVRMFPLEITIPPGSPSVNRTGSRQGDVGRIVLATTHPELKEIEIKVSFVVEN